MTEPQDGPPAYDPFAPPGAPPPQPRVYGSEQAPAQPADYGRFAPLPDAATPAAAPSGSRRGLLVGVLALLLVAVGIGVGVSLNRPKPDEHAVIQTTEEPTAGLGTVVHAHGITIVLPEGWTNVPTTPAELRAAAARVSTSSPALAKAMKALAVGDLSHFALLAVHVDTTGRPQQNLDVGVGDAIGTTLDQGSVGIKTQLAQAGATDLVSSSTTVGSLPALEVKYQLEVNTATGPVPVPETAFLVIENNQAAVITFANPPTDAQMKEITDSFQFG